MKAGLRLVVLLVCLVGWGGCQPRSSPPGPTTLIGTAECGTYTFLFWKGGPTLLICSDLLGPSGSQGGGSSEDPVFRGTGYHSAHDGRRFEWSVENTKLITDVNFTLAGKKRDLTKGTLFLVIIEGGEAKVQQLNRDLSTLQPTTESCQAFLAQDPDVSKLIKPWPVTKGP